MKKRQIIILFVVAQATLIGLACWGLLKHRANYKLAHQSEIESLKKLWGAGTFVKLNQPESNIVRILKPIVHRSSDDESAVSSKMEKHLSWMLAQMLTAFSKGDETAYRAFHFPLDAKLRGAFDTNRMTIIRKAARKDTSFKLRSTIGSMPDEDLFLAWGEHLEQVSPPETRPCFKCWRKANFSDTRLIYQVATNKLQVQKDKFLGFSIVNLFKQNATGIASFYSGITFHPTCEDVFDKVGRVLFVSARIPLNTSTGEVGFYPLYVKLYWSPVDEKWIPIGLAYPSSEMSIYIWF